ncbi:MAG: glycerophosphodiester phosphodiesterase family protein [Myxococcota bacterium]|nr:glycerophosphodiester phosphodiesterase family protein [Myxococcota bacterium]
MSTQHRLVLVLVLVAVAAATTGCLHEPPPFVTDLPAGPLIIAHRGGADIAPENTMPAFDLAFAAPISAEVVELDLHTSADGELMVIHDRSVDRMTGEGNGCATEQDSEEETYGTVRVHELTVAEVQAFDAGYCYEDPNAAADAPDDERYPYRGQGVVIPTLREVLETHADRRFILEVKQQEPSVVEPLIALLEELNRFDSVCFLDFDEEVTAEYREKAPEHACVSLSGQGIRCWASEAIMPFGGGACEDYDLGMVPHENGGFDLKKDRFVSNLQALGMPVFMWTVNEDDLMREVLELGVDGVVTDRPDALRTILEE